MSDEQQLPLPRASRPLPERREARALPEGRPVRPPAKKPDPRPMRVVYGAGAVAAVSIMAVGLVQPDWSSNADPSATDDSWQPTDDPGAVAALPDGTPQGGQTDPTAGTDNSGGKPRHVIHYVYLKPGQTAPPGATVISASAPPPRVVNNHPGPNPTATPRPNPGGGGGGNGGGGNGGGGNNGGGSNAGGPVATPRPTPRPTQPPAATPPPTPRPTPKTHQSGHP